MNEPTEEEIKSWAADVVRSCQMLADAGEKVEWSRPITVAVSVNNGQMEPSVALKDDPEIPRLVAEHAEKGRRARMVQGRHLATSPREWSFRLADTIAITGEVAMVHGGEQWVAWGHHPDFTATGRSEVAAIANHLKRRLD